MDKKKIDLFFDLDGTLIDVSKRHYAVYCNIVSELKGKVLAEKRYWTMKRNKTDVGEILKKSLIDKRFTSYFITNFKKLIEDHKYLKFDKIFPYSLSVLRVLSEKYNLFLVTFRKAKKSAISELANMGLVDFFKTIEFYDNGDKNVVEFKLKAINRLKKDNKAVIIGDTEADIQAGRKMKILSIAVLSGIRNKKLLEAHNPDYIIKNISQLPKLLA